MTLKKKKGGSAVSSYRTEQKKLLLEFLSANKDNSLTIDEITEGIQRSAKESDSAPGKSTVYRLMNKLLEEGKVRRFTKQGTRQSAYQLVEGAQCSLHLHLKCTECGKLFHMNSALSSLLVQQISANHRFNVSQHDTVLYGKCRSCDKK